MPKRTVLSIDDDENLQFVLSEYLESEGYKVITASDTASALEKIEIGEFGIVLLDLILKDSEGLSLIPIIKSKTNAGIIVVSGKSDTTEKIVCMEMGADDYITKPFEMRELSVRVKALARRLDPNLTNSYPQEQKSEGRIEFSCGFVDRAQYQVFDKENKSLEFTTGEFQLLDALVRAPNRALSREQLFELTRDGEFDVYDRAIDIQIARIRKKLGDTKNRIIKTVRGIGYMYSSPAA